MQLSPERRAEIAAHVGRSEQYLYQCLTGRRDMNAAEASRIERESGGEITRRQLRQSDWWLIWPDLVTPEFPVPTAQFEVQA